MWKGSGSESWNRWMSREGTLYNIGMVDMAVGGMLCTQVEDVLAGSILP